MAALGGLVPSPNLGPQEKVVGSPWGRTWRLLGRMVPPAKRLPELVTTVVLGKRIFAEEIKDLEKRSSRIREDPKSNGQCP